MYQNLFDMHKTVFISLPIEDLQTVIIDCVNSCLKNNTQGSKPTTEQPEQWLALNDLQEAARPLKRVQYLPLGTAKGHVMANCPYCKRGKRLYFPQVPNLMECLKAGA